MNRTPLPRRTQIIMTPAMAAGVENRLWSIEELVERTSR